MGLRSSPQGPGGPPTGGGSTGGYGANLDVMLSASQYVEHVGQTMRTGVRNLFDTLQLSATQWGGDASRAFHRARDDSVTALGHLATALDEIANGLGTTHKDLSQLEHETEAAINQVTQGLPYR